MGLNDENMVGIIGETTTKECINLTYLLDTSGSMVGQKINQLNVAMSEAVQTVEEEAISREDIKILMRVIEFNSTAHWLIGDAENGVEHIDWQDLSARGGTNTAGAIRLTTDIMHTRILGTRNYQPVVILITDGESNDYQETINAAQELKASLQSKSDPSKDKIIRVAIGVENANRAELEAFASKGNIEHADGTVEENVPLVFEIDDINQIRSVLKSVTISSIVSSAQGGTAGSAAATIQADQDDPNGWRI